MVLLFAFSVHGTRSCKRGRHDERPAVYVGLYTPGPDPNIMKWIGKGHLVTIDYDALNGNKPRLRLSHVPWKNLVHPEDPFTIPPSGWIASLPLSVMGT